MAKSYFTFIVAEIILWNLRELRINTVVTQESGTCYMVVGHRAASSPVVPLAARPVAVPELDALRVGDGARRRAAKRRKDSSAFARASFDRISDPKSEVSGDSLTEPPETSPSGATRQPTPRKTRPGVATC